MRPIARDPHRVVRTGIIGVGLDTDGHSRTSNGDGFFVVGGTDGTHKLLQRRIQFIFEHLKARGRTLENATKQDIRDLEVLVEAIV